MLIALYHDSGIEIEGTSQELRNLARSIRECETLCHTPLSAPTLSDGRGLRSVKELVVRVDSNLLKISAADEKLFVAGARDKLALFSANIDWLADSQERGSPENRDHLHIEFYPGHFFLSEDALPIILVRKD
jgi:hypothetical protein